MGSLLKDWGNAREWFTQKLPRLVVLQRFVCKQKTSSSLLYPGVFALYPENTRCFDKTQIFFQSKTKKPCPPCPGTLHLSSSWREFDCGPSDRSSHDSPKKYLDVPLKVSTRSVHGLFHLLKNGVYWGYNPLKHLLLTSWDIQVRPYLGWWFQICLEFLPLFIWGNSIHFGWAYFWNWLVQPRTSYY